MSWHRWVVLLGLAAYLTFGRFPMLAFVRGEYQTSIDYAINYGVVSLAVLLAVPGLFGQLTNPRWLPRFVPWVLLMVWVAVGIVRGEAIDSIRTDVLNVVTAVYLGSQISRRELGPLRYCVLAIAVVFTLLTLTYGSETLMLIRTGWVRDRLGLSITNANGVLVPRIMYIMVFSCMATILIDRRLWMRIVAGGLMVIPAIIGLAGGGRGALLALVVASVAFVLALKKKTSVAFGVIVVGMLACAGYQVVIQLFPFMADRIASGDPSGRLELWQNVLANVSIFGQGTSIVYPHNVFLEFLQDYGIVGLVLWLVVLAGLCRRVWRVYSTTGDREVLWVIGLIVLQLTAQQFSLNMFYPFFWATIALPLGLSVEQAEMPVKSGMPIWPEQQFSAGVRPMQPYET